MLKWGVILVILLVLPIVYSEELNIPETFKSSNTQVTTYFYTGDDLIATKDNSGVKYYSQDRLGSNRLTTNNLGVKLGEEKTLPFGEEILNTDDNKFTFTGKELDSNLYYFGARYYDANTGRFTSVDPLKENNDYSYVNNNPINLIDNDGKKIQVVLDPKLSFTSRRNEYYKKFYDAATISLQNELQNPSFVNAIGMNLVKDPTIDITYYLYSDISSSSKGTRAGYYDTESKRIFLNVNVLFPQRDGIPKSIPWMGMFALAHETKHLLDFKSPQSATYIKIEKLFAESEHVEGKASEFLEYFKQRLAFEENANNVAKNYLDSLLAQNKISKEGYNYVMTAVSKDWEVADFNQKIEILNQVIKQHGPEYIVKIR